MSENAIQVIDTEKQMVDALKTHMNVILRIRNEVFVENVDYGIIPGTGTKPVLLLPGMEKLIRTLHLRPVYVPATTIEDFDKPLFMYRYECRLFDIETDKLVATAIGSANSKEAKWAYRTANRICPKCAADAIIKGKAEYGGGWLCFAKKGGCGAKFQDGDETIESQSTGRIDNPDIFDQINTIDKIAQKRSLSSAIKLVAGVSEYFTVDLDDISPHVINDNVITIEEPPTPPKTAKKGSNSAFSKKQDATPTSDANGAEIESGGDGQLQAAAWVQNGLRRQRFMQYAMGEEFGNLQVSEVYEALGIVEDLTEYEGDEQRAMACMVAYASGYEPDAINARVDAMTGKDDFKANLRAVALSMTALGTMDF